MIWAEITEKREAACLREHLNPKKDTDTLKDYYYVFLIKTMLTDTFTIERRFFS